MRYLGAYPSEEELTSDILPSLSDDDDALGVSSPGVASSAVALGASVVGFVRLDRFESMMLRVLLDRLYEPDSEEMILQAFKVLDPENRGYIEEHTMHELLTENEWSGGGETRRGHAANSSSDGRGKRRARSYLGLTIAALLCSVFHLLQGLPRQRDGRFPARGEGSRYALHSLRRLRVAALQLSSRCCSSFHCSRFYPNDTAFSTRCIARVSWCIARLPRPMTCCPNILSFHSARLLGGTILSKLLGTKLVH